ncbi:MAG: hypothetical protein ACE5IY_06070 [bacterium]
MEQRVKTGISYFGNRNPDHFKRDLEEILRHSCTYVVHTFSENDQQFYKEAVTELVALSEEAGLECYLDPWGVGRVFGGETYSGFALRNLDTLQILPDGKPAPAVCFNHPRFRQFMLAWIADGAEMGAQVLFWDEPHFFINLQEKDRFDLWYCRCDCCQAKFQQSFSGAIEKASHEEIKQFREACVVEFLTELCDATRAKGMRNAVCLLPFKDAGIGLSDWSRVAAIDSVDIFGTDPYWMFFNQEVEPFVREFSREVVGLCRQFDKEAQIWIQAYKIISGREGELKQAISVAYAEGVRNFAAWSYYGNAYMSYNRSENPARVWDVIGEVYEKLSAGQPL